VEELAAHLGPLVGPLAGKAVDLVAAGYLARSLSQPTSPKEGSGDGGPSPGGPFARAAGQASPERCPAPKCIATADESSRGGIHKMPTESWLLSEECAA
jgi:hypothetical protein